MKLSIFDIAIVGALFLVEDVRWRIVSVLQSMDVELLIVLLLALVYTQRRALGFAGKAAGAHAHGGH